MERPLAALYLRLSREDEDRDHLSQSIQNQRDFLLDYCAREGIAVGDLYIDDGYSGTTFDRPAFRRMLEDIEARRIQMVLTKDLSRLGRDYILTGHYLERYFPQHRVRYVAVNDQIDTENESSGNDLTPFRAVFNDMYAKDISKKVRTALLVKGQTGQFIGTYAPYGYRKDPACKNHLLPDDEQAMVVRRIYALFLAGVSVSGVARKLTDEGIPPPGAAHGQTRTGAWSFAMVKRILTMPTYRGDLVSHMTQKISYKVDQVRRLPPSQWHVIPGTHEGLVTPEQFELVQSRLQVRSYTRSANGEQGRLTGLLFCKACGAPMVRSANQRGAFYVCSRWKYAPAQKGCTSHRLPEVKVMRAIWEAVVGLIRQTVQPSAILQRVWERAAHAPDSEALTERLRQRYSAAQDALLLLQQDGQSGLLQPQEVKLLDQQLKIEAERLQKQLEAVRQVECGSRRERFEKQAMALLQGTEPNRATLIAFVERADCSDCGVTLRLRCKAPAQGAAEMQPQSSER